MPVFVGKVLVCCLWITAAFVLSLVVSALIFWPQTGIIAHPDSTVSFAAFILRAWLFLMGFCLVVFAVTVLTRILALGVIIPLLLAVVVAVPLGMLAALKRRSWQGFTVSASAQVGMAIPAFWAGILLSVLFGVRLGWLPTGGWIDWSESWIGAIRSLVLPVLSLGLIMAAVLIRYVRSAVLDVMNQDYVRTARAAGMTRTQALLQVGLRNAALPIVTIVGLQIAELIGGTVIIEMVFSLPGLSRMILANVAAREVIVVQSTVMLIIVFVIFVNFAVDLLYGILDPRIRNAA